MNRHAVELKKSRQHRLEAREVNFHAHFRHCVDIRTRNAAVKNVADDYNFQARKSTFGLLNREQVQKCLRRVRVCSVARVDDYRLDGFGCEIRRAFRFVPHDNRVDAHGLNRAQRVAKTFAFDD